MIRKPVEDVLSLIGADVKVEIDMVYGYLAEKITSSGIACNIFAEGLFNKVCLLVEENKFDKVKETLATKFKNRGYVEYALKNEGDVMATFAHNAIYFKVGSGKFDDVFDSVNYQPVNDKFPQLQVINNFHGLVTLLTASAKSPELMSVLAFYIANTSLEHLDKMFSEQPYFYGQTKESRHAELRLRDICKELVTHFQTNYQFNQEGILSFAEYLIDNVSFSQFRFFHMQTMLK